VQNAPPLPPTQKKFSALHVVLSNINLRQCTTGGCVGSMCSHVCCVSRSLLQNPGMKLPLIETDHLWQPVHIRLLYLDGKYARKSVSHAMPGQQSKHTCKDTNVSKVTETKLRLTVWNICSTVCVGSLIRVCTVMLGVSWEWQILPDYMCTVHVLHRGSVAGIPTSGRSWVPVPPRGPTFLLTQWFPPLLLGGKVARALSWTLTSI
jgi:hypothetical protein